MFNCRMNYTNDVWVCEFQEGPDVLIAGKKLPAYLCIIRDYDSRYVVEGRYYQIKSVKNLQNSLVRAWSMYGISKTLYLNVMIDHAAALESIYHLQPIRIMCMPVYVKDEMMFSAPQNKFAPYQKDHCLPLDELNKKFSDYIDTVYNPKIHDRTGQSPIERYGQLLSSRRYIRLKHSLRYGSCPKHHKPEPNNKGDQ